MPILFLLLFVLALGFVGHSANGLRHYMANKDKTGIFVTMLCIMLGLYGGYFSGAKLIKSISVPVSATATAQPRYIPLTHIFDKKEVWRVVSQFEPVDGAPSLYVAQAHRQGEHDSVNRLIFLDRGSCFGTRNTTRIPRTGDMVAIQSLDVRVSGGSNTVTKEPVSVMAFVQPECQ